MRALVRGFSPIPRVYAHREVLERTARECALTLPEMEIIAPEQTIDPYESHGHAQVAYLDDALKAVMKAPERSVLVTGPISKAVARSAGFAFAGQTELLAHASRTKNVAMMMVGPRLRVTLVTTHLALARISEAITPEALMKALLLTAESLATDFEIPNPRIGVAGLNPHAGDGGLFGDEEERVIRPCLASARQKLLDEAGVDAKIDGPVSPDAVFVHALQGRYDAVVAMYHDQGLIAAKLLDFHETVNMTLGLPFVRTSPDHGVAYDLVGTGRAKEKSFISAIELGLAVAGARGRKPPDARGSRLQ